MGVRRRDGRMGGTVESPKILRIRPVADGSAPPPLPRLKSVRAPSTHPPPRAAPAVMPSPGVRTSARRKKQSCKCCQFLRSNILRLAVGISYSQEWVPHFSSWTRHHILSGLRAQNMAYPGYKILTTPHPCAIIKQPYESGALSSNTQ